MFSKLIIVLFFMLAAAAAIPAGGWGVGMGGWGAEGSGMGVAGAGWGGPSANPWIPPWVAFAPWYPQWTPCTTIGSTCLDCNTKLVCTKVGGLQRACTDPTKPHCSAGACSATPSAECAPPTESTPEATPEAV